MTNVLMKCGCRANAVDPDTQRPVCVIHLGLCAEAVMVAEAPNLEGRIAKCSDCSTIDKSSLSMPFFEHRPNQEMDQYYCGCRGWN